MVWYVAGRLFRQLVDLLHFYLAFPIDDHTGEPLSDAAVTARHYARLVQLQRLLFRHHPALRDLALANCGTLQRREVLMPALVALPEEELRLLAVRQLRCGTASAGRTFCGSKTYGYQLGKAHPRSAATALRPVQSRTSGCTHRTC